MTFCSNGDAVLKHVDFSETPGSKTEEIEMVLIFSFPFDAEMFCFIKVEEICFDFLTLLFHLNFMP